MTDAVQVFPPGFRVTDADDNPVNNAKIKFREAGPGSPKTVYSDADLSVSLGTTVRTRSDGQPVVSEGSSTTTLIYVGADAYHIEITDADDAVIMPAKDNVKGAAVLAAAAVVIPPLPVVTTGSNLTLTADHNGNLINASGNTLTFTDAVTLDDGWHVWVRNSGSSGAVILSAASGVSFEGQSFTTRAMLPGEAMLIVSDGTAFRVADHTPPLLSNRAPILIADRVSSAPAATAGVRYIVAAAFSSFLDHQIIEGNGASFNAYTPPTDCGWLAYVQDEDCYYAFIGSAWVPVAVHIAGLTEETAPEPATDYLPFYDASASAPRKAKLQRLSGMPLIASGTISNQATLDIPLITGYRAFKIVLTSVRPQTDNVSLYMRTSTDGGSTFDSSAGNYSWGYNYFESDGGDINSAGSDSDTEIELATTATALGNAAGENWNGEITLYDPAGSQTKLVTFEATSISAAGVKESYRGVGARNATADIDAVRFVPSSGNLASGSWALYGYA